MRSCTKSDTINKLIHNISMLKQGITQQEVELESDKQDLRELEKDLEFELNN